MIAMIRLTLREVLNKKIFLVAAVLGAVFIALYGIALHYTIIGFKSMPSNNIWKAMFFPEWFSMGLYFASFLINLLAIFISVGTVSAEAENGILQSVVPKPIRRSEIILGKYTGYATALIVYGILLFAAILALLKIMGGYVPDNILPGLGLFLLQPLILLTLTVLGSIFLSTMANGIFILMLYVIATVGGMIETVGGMIRNKSLINIGIISSLLVPTDAAYRKMVSLLVVSKGTTINSLTMTPFGTTNPPSAVMVVYMFIYIILFLTLAIYIFNKRDI